MKFTNSKQIIFLIYLCFIPLGSIFSKPDITDALEEQLYNKDAKHRVDGDKGIGVDEVRPALIEQSHYQNNRKPQNSTKGFHSPLQSLKGLEEIEHKLADVDHSIETLSAQIFATRQEITDNAQIDNRVQVSLKIGKKSLLGAQKVYVKLDNYLIFDVADNEDLWMPQEEVMLYSGPLHRGEHRIDLMASLVDKSPDSIHMKQSQQHIVNSSFNIQVPQGKFNKTWIIEIKKSLESQQIMAHMYEN